MSNAQSEYDIQIPQQINGVYCPSTTRYYRGERKFKDFALAYAVFTVFFSSNPNLKTCTKCQEDLSILFCKSTMNRLLGFTGRFFTEVSDFLIWSGKQEVFWLDIRIYRSIKKE